ncbi:hypothetical protein BJ970_005022 [Saccharopolyspora phatthalungensis]|uniref:Uncharacterized protein n=1 Tax=Saccharopolyspora phatthalungensis TaxID=664693 RepID=A0A840QFJ1_9PSEU|nr:hypothetical protein [Saccharopolyspora phatthalungensis]
MTPDRHWALGRFGACPQYPPNRPTPLPEQKRDGSQTMAAIDAERLDLGGLLADLAEYLLERSSGEAPSRPHLLLHDSADAQPSRRCRARVRARSTACLCIGSTEESVMADDQPIDDLPTGYWVAFGYHNHVLPTEVPRGKDGKLTALCGVLTRPHDVSDQDDRPMCTWCSEQVHTGQIRIVPAGGGFVGGDPTRQHQRAGRWRPSWRRHRNRHRSSVHR